MFALAIMKKKVNSAAVYLMWLVQQMQLQEIHLLCNRSMRVRTHPMKQWSPPCRFSILCLIDGYVCSSHQLAFLSVHDVVYR